jgi:hypothetical protein
MKYSKGQWAYIGPMSTYFSTEFYQVVTNGDVVCQTSGDVETRIPNNLEEQKANAQLIAAAPELLEALETAKKLIERTQQPQGRSIIDEMTQIRNAISRAKGEL